MATTTSLLLVSITFNAPSPPSNFRRTYYWLSFYKSTPLNQWLPRVWLLLNVTGAGCTIVAKVPCCHKRLLPGTPVWLSHSQTLSLIFCIFSFFFPFLFLLKFLFSRKIWAQQRKSHTYHKKENERIFFGGMIQRRWRRHHRVSLCGAITSVALDIYGDLSIFSCLQIFQSPLLTTFMELFFGGPAF